MAKGDVICANPACREDIIERIGKAVKGKINSKPFWIGLGLAVTILCTALGIAYNAYGGRMKNMEQKQAAIENAQHDQARYSQEINTKVEVMKANQEHIKDSINDIKEMLQTIIKQNNRASNDPSGTPGH